MSKPHISDEMEERMDIFDELESNVSCYCKHFPAIFDKASGSIITDVDGVEYIDFFSGAGTLNYGHNNQDVKNVLIKYLSDDRIIHSLDMYTEAKREFLYAFKTHILEKRGLQYKLQFTGPTGASAVEAAFMIARLSTGRQTIISFTNAYHGLTLGALAATGSSDYKNDAYPIPNHHIFLPYEGYIDGFDSIAFLRKALKDTSSGISQPAAIILETIQAEGGIHVASDSWLQSISSLCEEFDIRLIIDDIQVGAGRTGTFFSFERSGIYPDIVVLSKSISGYGLPMSLLLFKNAVDVWKSGQHTGTFRGNNLAFIAATVAIKNFWSSEQFEKTLSLKSQYIENLLKNITEMYPNICPSYRGTGLIYGLQFNSIAKCAAVSTKAFLNKVIIERCGDGSILKLLPALTIEASLLEEGLSRITKSISAIA